MKRGKKYTEAAKAIDRATLYDPAEAIALVKKSAVAKFDETIEVHIRTGCDGRHADQQIRGAVVLPHGTGKQVRVLVFAKGDKVAEAEAAGAEFVGGEELMHKIQSENWFDFDVVVATPDMMGVVGRLGRVLGPKGLMPNPKAGTVTMDVTKAVKDIKAGKIAVSYTHLDVYKRQSWSSGPGTFPSGIAAVSMRFLWTTMRIMVCLLYTSGTMLTAKRK